MERDCTRRSDPLNFKLAVKLSQLLLTKLALESIDLLFKHPFFLSQRARFTIKRVHFDLQFLHFPF